MPTAVQFRLAKVAVPLLTEVPDLAEPLTAVLSLVSSRLGITVTVWSSTRLPHSSWTKTSMEPRFAPATTDACGWSSMYSFLASPLPKARLWVVEIVVSVVPENRLYLTETVPSTPARPAPRPAKFATPFCTDLVIVPTVVYPVAEIFTLWVLLSTKLPSASST